MRTARALLRMAGMAITAACGCNGAAYVLDVGNDSTPDGGSSSRPDATTAPPSLAVSIAQDVPPDCTGGCTELTAHVTGGVAPYAYAWSPDAGADAGVVDVCPISATTYTVTVTDSTERSGGELPMSGATASATVTVGAAPDCGVDRTIEDAGTTVYWAEWQTVDGGFASGVMSPPSGSIQVRYAGDISIQQASNGDDDFAPSAIYTSATVSDGPPPSSIAIGGGAAQTDTLTFSQPVKNPLIAITNLGSAVSGQVGALLFDVPYTILSSGLNAAGPIIWGNETLVPVDGGVSGIGANGVIELEGTFTTIRWPDPTDLTYVGFSGMTVGVRVQR